MMMNSTLKAIIGIGTLLFLTSCNHYFYVPAVQAPLFTEKNEFRAAASQGYGDEGSIETTNIQLAYSITKNISVMTDFMYVEGGLESTGDYSHGGKGNYFDGAMGYYKLLDKNFVFEVHGGLGYSNQQHFYESKKADLSLRKIFVQPSIGFTHDYFDIAFTPLISNVYYYNINNSLFSGNYVYDGINELSRQRSYFFLEPAITIRVGWKYVKVQVQFIGIHNFTASDLEFTGQTNIGLIFSFADKYRRKSW